MRRAKNAQYVIGKNQAAINFIKTQGVSGELIEQTQRYLDTENKTGILSESGGILPTGVAQTIATHLMPGTTAGEIQKMAKSGELKERMYYSAKTDIGATSRIKHIKEEIQRISSATKSDEYYYKDLEGNTARGKGWSREDALELALKKLDIEQKVQGINDVSEGSKGKSLNTVVASPILNYWNNKWSL